VRNDNRESGNVYTDVMQFEVEATSVADSVAILVPAPQRGRTCVTVSTRCTGPTS